VRGAAGKQVELDVRGRPKQTIPAAKPSTPVTIGLPSKLTVEFIGTFLLAFTVAIVVPKSPSNAALAIGSTLMCAIYAGGHVSGANYNPAVSLAIFVRGKLSFVELLSYTTIQLIAGFSAGLAAMAFVPSIGYPAAATGAGYGALTVEIVLTFALCHTVLHVATTTAQANNSYYGLAIGFTVLSGAISVGGVSGGAFNPAVGCLALAQSTSMSALVADPMGALSGLVELFLSDAWVYAAGPMAGGLLAGVLFRVTSPAESADPAGAPLRSLREGLAPFLIEIVGTYLLCFTVATAASPNNGSNLAPLSIGSMLMAQVYAGGATSGANYNPAVTLGVYFRRAFAPWETPNAFPMGKALGYVVVQALAAAAAAATVLFGTSVVPGYPSPTTSVPLLAVPIEAVGTFFLVTVVLQTATSVKTKGNSFYGLAIGFTVVAMACTLGPLSGGAFNPAVGVLGLTAASDVAALLTSYEWVYAAGPLLGGLIAALLYRLVMVDEFVAPMSRSMV